MGGKTSKPTPIDVETLPRLYPEEDYVIKTRPPMPDEWRVNILRGKREDEFRHDSYAIVRRKCYDYVSALQSCVKSISSIMFEAFRGRRNMGYIQLPGRKSIDEKILEVELDKRRRDMSRNPEWWWRSFYDENGEIGDQAEWDGSSFIVIKLKEAFGIRWRKSEQQGTNISNNSK